MKKAMITFMELRHIILGAQVIGILCVLVASGLLEGCSTNPATGKQQFAALMGPEQEKSVGVREHEKIVAQFGLYEDPALLSYVRRVGQRVTRDTERPDIVYQFYIIDSPIVNAFALPGGYIYISRGLLALANSEAELAAVLAHEAGHITGRHAAERYSHGVLTSLGAAVISAAVDHPDVGQALNLGSNLYLSSYSRGQEHEADSLGLRYMSRAGYDPQAMSRFLNTLEHDEVFRSHRQNGAQARVQRIPGYFSTHPATSERVAATSREGEQYPAGDDGRAAYLAAIEGLIYGDSATQGFVRGSSFYHPELGFGFDLPQDFEISNGETAVTARAPDGSALVFDMAQGPAGSSATDYLARVWMRDQPVKGLESITINGLAAAAAYFDGRVNDAPMTIRLIAIDWGQGRFARFQLAIPRHISNTRLDAIKIATYSFRRLSVSEISRVQPLRITMIVASAGDTVSSLAGRQAPGAGGEALFRLLNGLNKNAPVIAGQKYKVVR
ncbi:MAG: M48 family metalloprotease [Alphaproteobacteria bacterium]|nr:M48 family metalloprotease [Alphaproteobacteria bacterium]